MAKAIKPSDSMTKIKLIAKITEDDFNKPVPHLSNRILRDHVAAGVTYELQIVQEMNDPNLEFPHKKDSMFYHMI